MWRELANHGDDCYFCTNYTFGYNSKTKNFIKYNIVSSVTMPVLESLHNETIQGNSDQQVSSEEIGEAMEVDENVDEGWDAPFYAY